MCKCLNLFNSWPTMLFMPKVTWLWQEFRIQQCLMVMTHVVHRSKVLDSWSLLWTYNRFCSPKWKRVIPAKGPIQSNFTLCEFLLRLPLRSHVIVERLKRGVPLLQANTWLKHVMLKQITKQHLSPNAPLQEIIKRIFIRHLHGCRSSLWAKDPSWSSPKFCNASLRMMSHPLSARLTWKSKGIQNICELLDLAVDLRMWQGLN